MSADKALKLPNFDLKQFEESSDQEKKLIIERLKACCQEHGFFTVSGHGVTDDVIASAVKVTRSFFALPQSVKQQVVKSTVSKFAMQERGYIGSEFKGINPILDNSPPDINEAFMMGRNLNQKQIEQLEDVVREEDFAVNVWPDAIPEMAQIMDDYFEEVLLLAYKLFAFLQPALDFEMPQYDGNSSLIKINHYPHVEEDVPENQWRITEHADGCIFTILLPEPKEGKLQDHNKRGGLEVKHKELGWCRAVYDPDCFVVNCGDTLKRLSDGSCQSSFHRVDVPEPSITYDNSRISLAYIFLAEHDINTVDNKIYDELRSKSLST